MAAGLRLDIDASGAIELAHRAVFAEMYLRIGKLCDAACVLGLGLGQAALLLAALELGVGGVDYDFAAGALHMQFDSMVQDELAVG